MSANVLELVFFYFDDAYLYIIMYTVACWVYL